MSATTASSVRSGTYVIDPENSRIGFVARTAIFTKVRGTFDEFVGSGHLDADDPKRSHLELTINAASIDTRNSKRDDHLRSDDFFAVDTYPEIRFVSAAVHPVGPNRYRVTGDLRIKGVTRPISVEVELTGSADDQFGNQRIGLEATAIADRRDWGVKWNTALDAGGVLISDKVRLEIDVSAIRVDDGSDPAPA